MAEVLVAHGADINAKAKDGDTSVATAKWLRRAEVADFLLCHKDDE